MFTFSAAVPIAACWTQPEPFETISNDGNKVFVFIPVENSFDNAYAAVYEIIDGERQLIYEVEGLSSFAYKSNFHFSTDMMHFARIFPPLGMYTFEVFYYGIRTRVVMRYDFIEDNVSVVAYSSVGPFYAVTWMIEEYVSDNTTIKISTDEGIVFFDLVTAKFDSEEILPIIEDISPIIYEPPLEVLVVPIVQTFDAPFVAYESPAESSSGIVYAPLIIAIAFGIFFLGRFIHRANRGT